MSITFNQAFYQQIQDIIAVVRAEGQYVFSCKSQDNECWISFFGLDVCFVDQIATRLVAKDMDIVLSRPSIANDNFEAEGQKDEQYMQDFDDLYTQSQEGGEEAVSDVIPQMTCIDFRSGAPDVLNMWHKELLAFRPSVVPVTNADA